MTDYGLRCTIHDLDQAVQDAVDRAHGEYEPKFYDWMRQEIEQHVQDGLDTTNTRNGLSADEVEGMIEDTVGTLGDRIREVLDYDYDFVLESDVVEIVRDYCDEHRYVTEEQTNATLLDMKHTMMSMQAELDFLHEKHVENVERRLGARLSNGVSRVVIIAKRAAALALAIIPTLTWKKKNNA